jgi:hypothetical protein
MHRQAGAQGRQRFAVLPNAITQPMMLTQNVPPLGPIACTGPIVRQDPISCQDPTSCKYLTGRTNPTGRTRSPLTLAILIFMSLGLAACHKAAAPAATATVTVVISPTSTSLNVGTKTAFSATASGGSLNTVTWQVNGTTGGNSSVGTIDSSGTYTAPTSVPSSNTVTVTAVSTDLTSVTASSTVTILPPAIVTISPTQASLTAGATQPFTATVQGAPTSTVVWQVNGQPTGTLTLGTITSTGIYTAPPSPPPGATVTVTAIAQSDPSQSASATVSLSFGSASLHGSYAFSLTGKNAAGPFARAGSFSADGTGGLQGGVEDVHDSSGVRQNISFAGTYSVGVDGRGTLSFSDGLTPSNFRIVLASNSQVQIIGFDPAGSAQGAANLSDPSTFLLSAFSGVYVFDFAGVDNASKAFSEIGEVSLNGTGGIVSGLEDRNDNGTLSSKVPLTGTYTVNANGRGTAQLVGGGTTANLTFYIVSRGSAKFLEVDASPAPIIAGPAVQQTPNATFNQGSLNGRYAFLLSGTSPSGTIATAGSFSAAGTGTLTSGSLDENNNGSVLNAQPFTGSYSIDSTGRGTASFQALNRTYSIVFYLAAQGGAILQETDSSLTSDGLSAAQSATFAQSAFAGSYAAGWNGTSSAATQQIAAQLSINNTGNVTGSLDLSTVPGSQISAQALNGTLAVAASGRGTLQLNPSADNRNFAVYAVSPSLLFTVGTDSTRVAAGSVIRQF